MLDSTLTRACRIDKRPAPTLRGRKPSSKVASVSVQDPECLLLFQYGSNMSVERLRAKVGEFRRYAPPEASLEVELLGAARLPGWQFVLDLYSAQQQCLVGDIIEGGDGDEVWGALYELDRELVFRSDGARSLLDRIEGHRTVSDPENYRPRRISVQLNEELREAWTYIGHEEARQRCNSRRGDARPRRDYINAILDGARSVALPSEYVRVLTRAIEMHAASRNDSL
jgi:gamma-glutamylcyclotransferase (GGCT)/AIG2-like uncharacterized protein YtfP